MTGWTRLPETLQPPALTRFRGTSEPVGLEYGQGSRRHLRTPAAWPGACTAPTCSRNGNPRGTRPGNP